MADPLNLGTGVCDLWFDAGDGSTISATAGAVDTWTDKSGSSHNATASTTARPTTGSRYLNGHNVLDFDGSANHMTVASYTTRLQPYTLAVVCVNDDGATSTAQRPVGDITNGVILGKAANNTWVIFNGNAINNGTVDTNPHIFIGTFSSTVALFELDGVVIQSGANSGSSSWQGGATVGGKSDGTNLWNGPICEIILYSTALAAAPRAVLQNYLYYKWVASPIIVTSPPPAYWTPLTLKQAPLPATAPVSGTSRTLAATIPTADGAFATTANRGKNFAANVGTSASAKATKTLRAAHLTVKSPTADNTKAAIVEAERLASKAATSASAKATGFIEAKHYSNKVATATTLHTATITISGTVSFSGKISEAKTAAFRRVAAPTTSNLTRTYQGAAPTVSMVRPTLRRAVRRTGKMGTSSSSKAHLAYGRRIVAKSPLATSSKASLDTTSTAQGNPPAIPATLANGVPASKLFGWAANTGPALTGVNTAMSWKTQFGVTGLGGNYGTSQGFKAVALESQPFYFYFTGTDTSNVPDPLSISASYTTKFNWEHAYMGYGVPSINGGTYGTVMTSGANGPNGIGPKRLKDLDPTWDTYLTIKQRNTGLPPVNPYCGDWFSDSVWNEWVRFFKNFAAGLKLLNMNGLQWDWESGIQTGVPCTSTTRPGSPLQGEVIHETDTGNYYRWTGVWTPTNVTELHTVIESRGHQVGQAIFSVYPNMTNIMYGWIPPGSVYDLKYATLQNRSSNTGVTNAHDWYFEGIMRAQTEVHGTGLFLEWDQEYYVPKPFNGLTELWTQMTNSNCLSWLSRNLPAATRDWMMPRLGIVCPAWANGGTGATGSGGSWPDQGEPAFSHSISEHRRFSMFGMRSIYHLGSQQNSGPDDWPTLQTDHTVSSYTYAGTNPPGNHLAGLQAAKSTTPQDTMTVAGSVGIYQVVSVGHGANPQATVECELTATVTNNSGSTITNPGVGFYDASTNAQVGFGAIGTGTLAPGASMTFSTLTSPSRSAYIPAAAGDVTIRAKPGASGVDANQGVVDQTITIGAAPPPPPAGTRLWADASPWNTVKNQSGIVFVPGADGALSGAPVNLNFDFSFNHPTYFATVNDHLVTINLGHSQIDGHTGGTLSKNAPAGMQPATGGDNVMFIQFTDGTYIDGYAVTKNSDTNFTFGEYVYSVDAGHGDATTATGFGFPGDGHRAGTTGIGSAQAGGTLLKRDVQAGTIPHGIFIAGTWDTVVGDGQAGTPQVLPAINNDVSGHHGPVPEGGLMLIPAATAMPGGLTAMEQQLFTALKTYGAYCCDTTASGNFYVVYSDGSAECNAAFTGSGVQTVCHLLRLVKTW